MSSVQLDRDNFFSRIKRLYRTWKDGKTEHGELFPKTDSIIVAIGSGDNVSYSKSLSLQIWLLGYYINDILMIFTENAVHFLASKKKIDVLRQIQKHQDEAIPPVKLHLRNKDDSDKENFEKLIVALKASGKGKTVGTFVKDDFPGTLVESWKKVLKKHGFENVDITNAVANLLSCKEDSELAMMKKACQISVDIYRKYLRDTIRDIIDSDKKVKHSKLADDVENAMENKKYNNNTDPAHVSACYPPIIQSGGNYSLKFSAQSDEKNLHFGVIVCSLGSRYKQYCSNIIRTLLVNPNNSIQDSYNFLVSLQEHLMSVLKAGSRLCDVYNSGINFAREKKPALINNLTKNFGFLTGIEFRENSFSIAPKTTACARKNQVYNLCVGLTNLVNKEAENRESKIYSLFIGDTVVVNEQGPATDLTNSKKGIKNVGIFLKNESDDDDEEDEKENEHQRQPTPRRGRRTAVLDARLRADPDTEEQRKRHQEELALKMNEEARKRLLSKESSRTESKKARKSTVSYKNFDQMPVTAEMKQLKIFVDKKYETVILPILGLPVPFHVSTIKNISQNVEGDHTYLRINFYHPGATMGREAAQFTNPDLTFTKEITYRSSNLRQPGETSAPSVNLNDAFHTIKEVQKKFRTREAEEKEKENLVNQDTLIISRVKANPKLKDLHIQPNIVNKKMTGTLEAHVNGFRYSSVRGDKVDILYNNIRQAFFQPCDGEMVILLHFHLKNAIMFGKKKHLDVQFYTEVGETHTDLGRHQNMRDTDDLAAEQAERGLRYKLNLAFKSFCEKVEAATNQAVDFDTPFRHLGFLGVPFRSTVLLQPSSNCLVNLTEWPPFVTVLDDVEVVYLQRVDFSLKNFDIVFVFKNYNHKVVTVSAIPKEKLDDIKKWLDGRDICYKEGVRTLDFNKILKTITADPEGFFETGGWTFLDQYSSQDSQENADESSDEDEAYEPDQSDNSEQEGSDSESSEDSNGEEDSEEEDSLSDESSSGSSEESGKDWSDLEKEAAASDRQRDNGGFQDEYSKPKLKPKRR